MSIVVHGPYHASSVGGGTDVKCCRTVRTKMSKGMLKVLKVEE